MRYLTWLLRRIVVLAAICASQAAASGGGEAVPVGEPSAYLYDAAEASVLRLAESWQPQQNGGARLDEDETAHRFAGCPVLANDRIVAVLRKDSPDIDLYSRRGQKVQSVACLQPMCDGTIGLQRTSVAIKANAPDAVSLEVGFRSPHGQSRRITYELNAGAPFIKTAVAGGVEKLRVQAPCRFAVLPDFFADDILLDASSIRVAAAEVPSENFLLHMLHGGEAILMSVSESRDNDIEIGLSDTTPREIARSDISYGNKPHIWIGILAGEGIWHQQAVTLEDAGKVLDLDWEMPFPALWRVDWSTVDKLTDSWEMLLQHPDGRYLMQGWFGQDESVGQRFGQEFGPRDWNKPGRSRWNPVLGGFAFPCWIDQDRSAHLQPLKSRRYAERGEAFNFAGPAVIYPLDRTQAAPFRTPLESLTVVDLVRLTLGVGPCQYILDLEGQKRNSRGVATCYARDVINAIYKEGTQLQNRAVIEEHLDAAVAFITNVRERIDEYVQFGRDLTAYLEEQKRRQPQHAEFVDELLLVTGRLDQFFEAGRERIHTPAFAGQNADMFRDKLLTYTGPDAYQQCGAQMGVFTSIGGAQDGLVASCRMIVKTLRQRSGLAMTENPDLKAIATEVRTRTQSMLRNPTPYEAPRH